MAITPFSRIYNLIHWKNKSEALTTPLHANNLNHMDEEIYAVVEWLRSYSSEIANNITALQDAVVDISVDKKTGVIAFTKKSGSSTKIDTELEKIPLNYSVDLVKQVIILELADGSKKEIDMNKFITVFEFKDSDDIYFEVSDDGNVKAHLTSQYLKDISDGVKAAIDNARKSQSYATGDAVDDEGQAYREGQDKDNSKYYCQQSKSYAVGGTESREGEDEDNSKYYFNETKALQTVLNKAIENCQKLLEEADKKIGGATVYIDFDTGRLMYESNDLDLFIDGDSGDLMYQVKEEIGG